MLGTLAACGASMSNLEEVADSLGLVGQKLGPYVVLEAASIGGFAIVYRGEHETLHNEVAIKVLTPEVAPDSMRETLEQLFLREAQILSQLRSEDILRAHDHGRAVCPKDGVERPYMVVDFLRGQTLAEEIDRRRAKNEPYTLPEAVELLLPIARALSATHAVGVVHRDVNPRNIFLEEQADGSVRAKLIDFGFAKTVNDTVRNLNVQRVNATLLARSPDYSAPEHYDREKHGELSEMTDIYTLALVMVEALTLSSPLRGPTPEALYECTASPDARPTPRTRGAEISDAAEALFEGALAVDQFERPTSVLAWFEELQKVATPAAEPSPAPAPEVVEVFPSAPPPRAQPGSAPPPPPPPPPPPEPSPIPEAHDPVILPMRRWPRRIGIAIVSLIFAGGIAAVVARFVPWPLSCPPNRGDCNGRALDACETDLSSELGHCGGCGKACPTQDAVVDCIESRCSVQSCNLKDHRDCNHDANDGCEVDLQTDVGNCGECGRACAGVGAKRVGCVEGKCQVACDKGHGDCDGKPETGCETALLTDAKNCGRCGFACGGTACDDGLCAPKLVATVKAAQHLAVVDGRVYFYDADAKQILRVSSGGAPERVAEQVGALASLVAGADVVVWSAEKPAAVFALATGPDAGPAKQIAGPLPRPSPLVLDVSGGFVSWSTRVVTPGTLPPLGKPNAVATARLDRALLAETVTPNDCKSAVAAFAGDAKEQILLHPRGPHRRAELPGGHVHAAPLHHQVPRAPEPRLGLLVLDPRRARGRARAREWQDAPALQARQEDQEPHLRRRLPLLARG